MFVGLLLMKHIGQEFVYSRIDARCDCASFYFEIDGHTTPIAFELLSNWSRLLYLGLVLALNTILIEIMQVRFGIAGTHAPQGRL